MRSIKFFFGFEQNPILPVLLVLLGLAAFVALAPDFEVPQSARAAKYSQNAKRWTTVDYYVDRHDGYQISSANWTRQAFN